MPARVFIDGEAGTTGLMIRARLEGRRDLELVAVAPEHRKDRARRAELLNSVDLAVLCLPDDAAREAVRLIENPKVRVIDASTAHRTDPGWIYGFPEMAPGHAARVAGARFVSNPGCYPTGVIGMLRPLVETGLVPRSHAVTVNAVSGYSGGGRALIESFEGADATASAHFAYALTLAHKHLPEMQAHSLLEHPPLFVPSVGRFRQGMLVQLPLQLWALAARPSVADIREALAAWYADARYVEVAGAEDSAALEWLDPEALNGTNLMRLHVFGNETNEQALVAAVLDNLGKGASGAAVQNLNLMLGLAEDAGLGPRLAA